MGQASDTFNKKNRWGLYCAYDIEMENADIIASNIASEFIGKGGISQSEKLNLSGTIGDKSVAIAYTVDTEGRPLRTEMVIRRGKTLIFVMTLSARASQG